MALGTAALDVHRLPLLVIALSLLLAAYAAGLLLERPQTTAPDGDRPPMARQVAIWVACIVAAWDLAESLVPPRPAAWAGLPLASALAALDHRL